jgi:hypothetical protein
LLRIWVMVVLAILLVGAVWSSWQFAWRRLTDKADEVLCADLGYWICVYPAGTLDTEIGHDLAKAFNYILKRWASFALFLEDAVCA